MILLKLHLLSRNYRCCVLSKQMVRCLSVRTPLQHPIDNYEPFEYMDGIIYKVRRKFGLTSVPMYRLGNTTLYLYESCTDGVDIEKFFKHCNLDDTYLSWFLITQLHVWMCMCRAMAEGKEGRTVRNAIVERMWEDSYQRLTILTSGMSGSKRREILSLLLAQFQASLFSYDEGLFVDDKTLAAAVWRILFIYKSVEPQLLETMVSYIRTQIKHLNTIDREFFLLNGRIKWVKFSPFC